MQTSKRYLPNLTLLMLLTGQALANEPTDKPPEEGLVMSAMTRNVLPGIKDDAARMKPVFTFGKQCFSTASNLDEARNCNKEAVKVAHENGLNDFEVEDFKQWNDQVRANVLKEIEGMLTYIACTEAARNITEYAKCDDPPI